MLRFTNMLFPPILSLNLYENQCADYFLLSFRDLFIEQILQQSQIPACLKRCRRAIINIKPCDSYGKVYTLP